jgi:hypothetical protein
MPGSGGRVNVAFSRGRHPPASKPAPDAQSCADIDQYRQFAKILGTEKTHDRHEFV